MYELGRRNKHRKRALALAAVALLLAAGAVGVMAAKHYIKPHTSLTQSVPAVRVVNSNETAMQIITEPTFSLKLPKSWRAVPMPQTSYHIFRWRGAAPDDSARSLDVYVDTIPTTLAVNRLMPVQAAGDHLTLVNDVSDNCADFTDSSAAMAGQGVVKAKWSGVDFLCDEANRIRNVVGTGSADGVNRVTLMGTQGTHSYFFTYTDNSGQANNAIFTTALRTFKAL